MSHRPSTANDAGPSRMSFSSAEVLLWGPEMKKQHAHLLTEMRALQKQHDGYDARIRAIETVAEAVEAAAARIGDLEDWLTGIKAKVDNEAFSEWASAQTTRLNTFVDTNENLRQKQSELETKVSLVAEGMARLLEDNVSIEDVFRRLDAFEHDRRDDAERIQGLEREVECLRSTRESDASNSLRSRTGLESRRGVEEGLMLPKRLDAGVSDSTVEPDPEESVFPRLIPGVPMQEEIQVPQSLEVQETDPGSTHISPPTNSHSIISARRRLLQRPSIHDAKLPRHMDEENAQPPPNEEPGPSLYHSSPLPTQLVSRKHWHNEPTTAPAPLPTPTPVPVPAPALATQCQTRGRSKANAATSEALPTQLVERGPPGKRKQPESGPPTQRQTRSQAKKNQAKGEDLKVTTGASAASETQPAQKTEPVSPPRKKTKATPAKQRPVTKIKTIGASQAAGRNTRATQNHCKEEDPSEQEPVISAKSAPTNTHSRKTKAAASRKRNSTPAPPPPANMNPRGQKRLIVRISPRQRAQEDINATQERVSASYSYCYDEL
ncbi:uncharacterized protein yc1106_04400 [Curvularia clavata]|uniref:Uncharacterized protein n=1 Tax=Curvularia clavata TaxID=95742 RepID=A0A9Q8Z689_CURCL|nr:uncharacterized protein yc1106_04400 [Curvularia clavata]